MLRNVLHRGNEIRITVMAVTVCVTDRISNPVVSDLRPQNDFDAPHGARARTLEPNVRYFNELWRALLLVLSRGRHILHVFFLVHLHGFLNFCFHYFAIYAMKSLVAGNKQGVRSSSVFRPLLHSLFCTFFL